MEVTFNVKWKNLITGDIVLDKKSKKWAMYNTSDLDMNNDNIDNDLDGFIDSQDSDEFGAPREGARIISNKISEQIITDLISKLKIGGLMQIINIHNAKSFLNEEVRINGWVYNSEEEGKNRISIN